MAGKGALINFHLFKINIINLIYLINFHLLTLYLLVYYFAQMNSIKINLISEALRIVTSGAISILKTALLLDL